MKLLYEVDQPSNSKYIRLENINCSFCCIPVTVHIYLIDQHYSYKVLGFRARPAIPMASIIHHHIRRSPIPIGIGLVSRTQEYPFHETTATVGPGRPKYIKILKRLRRPIPLYWFYPLQRPLFLQWALRTHYYVWYSSSQTTNAELCALDICTYTSYLCPWAKALFLLLYCSTALHFF